MKPITILVIDDKKDIVELIEIILKMNGLNVIKATSSKAAINKLKKQKVDLVISDIGMPDIDGFKLLDIVKKIHPHIPVVLMTGYYDIFSEKIALAKGAKAFLPKPFRAEELINIVEREFGYALQA